MGGRVKRDGIYVNLWLIPDNHDGVITHLEPDILKCELKWALESITMNKASEGMEFQLSYFKSQKMML